VPTIVYSIQFTVNCRRIKSDPSGFLATRNRPARRRLEDYARQRNQRVKFHESPPHGHITRLDYGKGYGFIETPDGREIYFHRNSVLEANFDRLEVGDPVRFHEETGEEGPQASTVHVERKVRATG